MAGRLPNKGRGPSSSPTWGWREQGGEASRAQQQCRARPPPPHPGGAGSGSGGRRWGLTPAPGSAAPGPAPPARPSPAGFLSPPFPQRPERGGTGDITAQAGGAAPRAHHFLGASAGGPGRRTVDGGANGGLGTGGRRWALQGSSVHQARGDPGRWPARPRPPPTSCPARPGASTPGGLGRRRARGASGAWSRGPGGPGGGLPGTKAAAGAQRGWDSPSLRGGGDGGARIARGARGGRRELGAEGGRAGREGSAAGTGASQAQEGWGPAQACGPGVGCCLPHPAPTPQKPAEGMAGGLPGSAGVEGTARSSPPHAWRHLRRAMAQVLGGGGAGRPAGRPGCVLGGVVCAPGARPAPMPGRLCWGRGCGASLPGGCVPARKDTCLRADSWAQRPTPVRDDRAALPRAACLLGDFRPQGCPTGWCPGPGPGGYGALPGGPDPARLRRCPAAWDRHECGTRRL